MFADHQRPPPQQGTQDQLAQFLLLRHQLPQRAWLDLDQARRLGRHRGQVKNNPRVP